MAARRTSTSKKQGIRVSMKITGGELTIGPKQLLAGALGIASLFGMKVVGARNAATPAPQAVVRSAPQPEISQSPVIVIINNSGNAQVSQATIDSAVAVAKRPTENVQSAAKQAPAVR